MHRGCDCHKASGKCLRCQTTVTWHIIYKIVTLCSGVFETVCKYSIVVPLFDHSNSVFLPTSYVVALYHLADINAEAVFTCRPIISL